MNYIHWTLFFVTFFVFSSVSSMMDGGLVPADAGFLDHILGFQVDKISQGAGFFGSIRVVVEFFTRTLPTWVTFDYSYLNQPSTEFVKALLMVVFGGPFVIMISFTMMGIVRRNV